MSKAFDLLKKEIGSLKKCTDEEMQELFFRKNADTEVLNRLVEGNAYRVLEIAKKFETSEPVLEDAVQEGMISLMTVLRELPDTYSENVPAALNEAIEKGMSVLIEAEKANAMGMDSVVEKLNLLDGLSRMITEKTGKAPTAEELADTLGISVQEVTTLLQIALQALEGDEG